MNRSHGIGKRALIALLLSGLALIVAPARVHAQDQEQPTPDPNTPPGQGKGTPPGQKAPTRPTKVDPARLEQAAQQRAQKIGKELGLTDEQVTQLAQMNSAVIRQMQVLFNTRPQDKDAEKLKLQRMMAQRQQTLEKLFTPEELEKYQAITQKDWAGLISEIVARRLKLSENQVKQLNTINQQIVHKLQAIAADKKSPSDERKAIAQVRAWKDQKYARVLTPAQVAELKKMRQYLTPTNADRALATENTKTNPYYGSPYDPSQPTLGFGMGGWGMFGWGGAYGGYYGYGGMYGTYSSVWPSYYLW